MDFTDVIRDMNQVTVERAVEAVFARLEAEGWTPSPAGNYELEKAREVFTQVATQWPLPGIGTPTPERPSEWNQRLKRLQGEQLIAWLNGESEPPTNVFELKEIMQGEVTDDFLALHFWVGRLYKPGDDQR